MTNLASKKFVVAGAAGRIGSAIVDQLLGEGATVVACDVSEPALQALKSRHAQAPIQFRSIDIANSAAVAALLNEFEDVDGAVNTAYPRNSNYGRRFLEVQDADFAENVALHLGAYFVFMRECTRFAVDRQRTFSLVNLSSIYGSMPPRFDIYAGTQMTMPVEYAAIKAGIEHLTRYANAFAKGSNFRANCVSPGGILAGQPESFLAAYRAHANSKGMLDSGDIVGTVSFLLSDASRYVVGQNLIVDDGFSL